MATAADIGAGFSNYTGNANLGGGTLGVLNIDIRPLQQLAQYTYLYNRSEYDQRQKDAEKAAEEIAEMTKYDLSSGIEKDSKQLQAKYDALVKFTRENPDAINYRNKEQYLELKRMQNDLANDITGAKVRSITFQARLADIQKNTNKDMAALDLRDLMGEVEATDIRTPLKIAQQFDVAIPEFKAPQGLTFDVYKAGENEDQKRKFTVFNVPQAREQAIVDELDLTKTLDPSTPEGERRAVARGQNFYTKGADIFNSALKNQAYLDANGKLDETKLKGVAKGMVELIKKANTYLENAKTEINAGSFRDEFNKPITFGGGLLKEEDYAPINYQDGISPSELSFLSQFASWNGDTYETGTIKTDNAIQTRNAATAEKNAQTARINAMTPSSSGSTTLPEIPITMDLTGYTGGKGGLSLSDMYALDPSFVTNDFGSRQLSKEGKKVEIEILPNGDVGVNPKYNKKTKKTEYERTITKEGYQKRAVEFAQTVLTERKGQFQAPFTNTGTNATGQTTSTQTASGLPIIKK